MAAQTEQAGERTTSTVADPMASVGQEQARLADTNKAGIEAIKNAAAIIATLGAASGPTAAGSAASAGSAGTTAAAQSAANTVASTAAKTAISQAAPSSVLQSVTRALTNPAVEAFTNPASAVAKGVTSAAPGRLGQAAGSLIKGDLGGIAEAATAGTKAQGVGRAVGSVLRGNPSELITRPRAEQAAARQAAGQSPEEAKFFQDVLAPILLGADVGSTLINARAQTLRARQAAQIQAESTAEKSNKTAGLPFLQEGGTIPPGGTAVVGEAGPEIATANPNGSTKVTPIAAQNTQAGITQQLLQAQPSNQLASTAVQAEPTTQPSAAAPFPGPQAAIAAPPEAPGFAGRAFELLQDGLILAESLRNPALFLQQRNARVEAQRDIARAALQNPTLLEVSPTVVGAFEAIHGLGTAQAFLERSHPGVINANTAVAFSIPVIPEGQIDANGQVALSPLAQITAGLRRQHIGFTIEDNGIIRPTVPAASFQERSQAAGFAAWDEARTQFINAGFAPAVANVLAAEQAVRELTAQNMIPDDRLLDMITADTDATQAAAKARMIKRGQLSEEVAVAGALASERARGSALGNAIGSATIPFMTINVPQVDGTTTQVPVANATAIAATGVPSAVSLGTNPSKTQLDLAAVDEGRLLTAPGGEVIVVPHGVGMGAPASAVLQGAEGLQALNELATTAKDVLTPEFLLAHPSEREFGRGAARTSGFIQSFMRQFTDPASVAVTRGRIAQIGFRKALLLGSNSQLSDAERANAQKPWQPVIDGTASREQIVAATVAEYAYLNESDRRIAEKRVGADGVDAVQEIINRLPSGIQGLEAVLLERVNAGRMSEQEAVGILRGVAEVL